jgi:hypothetical protein
MPYVEGQTVHDADAHVMELPGTLERYIAPAFRDRLAARLVRKGGDGWVAAARARQADPEFRAGAEANLLLRKNYEALGAFDNADRPAALDYFGFAASSSSPPPACSWRPWSMSRTWIWRWRRRAPTTV